MRVHAFAFGDLATGVWGIAASSDGFAVASFASELRIDDAPDESLLASAGLELRFAPTTEASVFTAGRADIRGLAQLCTVEGAVHWNGAERDVACLGVRAAIHMSAATPASARVAAAWLGPGDGFTLVALRPPGAAGHDADTLACALIEDGAAVEIEEPRFSTTYTATGLPARAGLELWPPVPDDDGDADADADADDAPRGSYPRRAAGERAGDAGDVTAAGITARAELFRWHAHGLEGAGVYVLIPAP